MNTNIPLQTFTIAGKKFQTNCKVIHFAKYVDKFFIGGYVWKHPSGAQCCEHVTSVEEFGQLMGGN